MITFLIYIYIILYFFIKINMLSWGSGQSFYPHSAAAPWLLCIYYNYLQFYPQSLSHTRV